MRRCEDCGTYCEGAVCDGCEVKREDFLEECTVRTEEFAREREVRAFYTHNPEPTFGEE